MTPAARRAGLGAVALLAVGLSGGCTKNAVDRPAVDVTWTLSPAAATVGPATLTITLRGPAGGAGSAGAVPLEGLMSHPGMAPVIADASERAPGVYEVPFAFTMPGDWALIVRVALPGGEQVE